MSTIVDQRVLEMQFDNKHFENNVQTSLSTLEKLKQSLNLSGATKGLESVGDAAKNCNFSPMASAVETVRAKFSALEVMAVTTLANITNSAVNAGKRLVSALTIDPIKMGLQEYETQINAVQTILANTKSKGTTLDNVNSALDELNTYADKTIYNFTEMTRNIGTFTAAGIDLDTSVSAIQGIANLAAVSGSTSQQASTAMYQLSQALATGTVRLMDWNSVVNAGMGGQVFQDALKKTSEALGTGAQAAIDAKGSFRESLQEGWLTAEVLTETLKKFTTSGANEYVAEYTGLSQEAVQAELDLAKATYGEAEAIDYAAKALAEKSGKSADEIKQALEFAQTAEDAATKVKTFSQLIDTMKESLQSGWTQSWEIIIGDFEEAKELWTNVSDYFGDAISKSAEARNNLLQAWKDGGGRDDLFAGIKNAFDALLSVAKPIKDAFTDIFPPVTANNLLTITERFKEFTQNLILSEEEAGKVKSIFKGLFSILDLGKKAVTAVLDPLLTFVTGDTAGSIGDKFLDIAASIGDFFTELNESVAVGEGFSKASDVISGALEKIGTGISTIFGSFDGIGTVLSKAWGVVTDVFGKVRDVLGGVFDWLRENISAGDIFAGLAGGGIFVAVKKFGGLLDTIKEAIEGFFEKKGVGTKFGDILGGIKDSLSSFSEGLKVASILGIAVAVTLLSSALRKIAELEPDEIALSVGTIALLMETLVTGFKKLCGALKLFNGKGLGKAAIAMIGIATAINILATAMDKISDLSWEEIAKGLIGVAGGIILLTESVKRIGKGGTTLGTSVAILALAEACNIMADALVKYGEMDWDEIGRGLVGMGGALAELVTAIFVLDKLNGKESVFGAVAVFIASQALDDMAEALKKFGEMAWGEIGRGLSAMGGALLEVAGMTGALGAIAGFSGIFASGSILITVQGLDDLAEALKKFGEMAWDEIGRGLSSMGGALLEVGAMDGALGIMAGFSSLFGASAIVLTIQGLDDLAEALKKFGEMAWDEIGRGLSSMGGALLEVGGMSGALATIAGFSGIFGAGTILLTIQGLDQLAESLKKFGEMSWDEIGRGLAAMGGALLEIGVVSGVLGYFTNIAGLMGAGTITLAAQGLGEIADALIKFGSMSWDEIGRGLTAMVGALGVLALGSFANSIGIIGAISIDSVAEPLGVLADSFKKFCGMDWDEVLLGVRTMSAVLGELALGGFLNTLSIIGSLSIAAVAEPLGILADSVKKWVNVTIPDNLAENLLELANAIFSFTFTGLGSNSLSTVAQPLGVLADSVKKWSDVTVPENLNTNLSNLADGVRSFTWLFIAGWSLSTISGPLGTLADDVKKWSGVIIPMTLKDGLIGLADGIKGFTWLFVAGWSLSAITGPLGDLADDVKKWSGVTIPESLKDSLKNLADGIQEFSIWDSAKISGIAEPLGIFATACQNLSSINIDGTKLITFAQNLKTCCTDLSGIDTTSVSTATTAVNKLVDMFRQINATSVSNVGAFVAAANSLNDISINAINVDTEGLSAAISAISDAMNSMADTMSNSKTILDSGMKTALSGLPKVITNTSSSMNSAVKALLTSFGKTIAGNKENVNSAFKTVVSGAVGAIKSQYSGFYSAGGYLVSGFAEGITANTFKATTAAASMARAALSAAKRVLMEKSPSKAFYKIGDFAGQGFVNAFHDYEGKSYKAGSVMAQSSMDGLRYSIRKIADVVNSGIDTQPTIRPVLDLSNVASGASAINGMFGMSPSVGVLSNVQSISSAMNRGQNGVNDEVISAIKDLGNKINSRSGDTYQINGITYDDGSNVAEAIQTLINAAKVERRI